MEFEKINCAVCGSDAHQKVARTGQFGLPAHVCVCTNCGLSFLNPRWTKERYHQFYSHEYDKYYRKQVINDDRSGFSPEAHEKNPYGFYPVLQRLKDHTSSFNRVMDLGAGNGDNIRYLMSRFPEMNAYAIESSLECIKTLEANNITVVSDDIDSNWGEMIHDKLDLVIMRHVFEHMLDPLSTLKKIKQSLQPNGLVYIAVPNSMKIKESVLDSFFRAVHTFYYSPLSITNLLHLGGFEVLSLVEGDDFNQREMWVLAKSNASNHSVVIDNQNAQSQLAYYAEKLAPERSFIANAKRWVKNCIIAPAIRLKKRVFS